MMSTSAYQTIRRCQWCQHLLIKQLGGVNGAKHVVSAYNTWIA